MADIPGFAVIRHFESFERDFFGIDFIVTAGFGQARIKRTVFREQRFQVADDVLGEVLQIFARLVKIAFGLFDFFAMFVDVE